MSLIWGFILDFVDLFTGSNCIEDNLTNELGQSSQHTHKASSIVQFGARKCLVLALYGVHLCKYPKNDNTNTDMPHPT